MDMLIELGKYIASHYRILASRQYAIKAIMQQLDERLPHPLCNEHYRRT
jgi:hypothetical protein